MGITSKRAAFRRPSYKVQLKAAKKGVDKKKKGWFNNFKE